MLGSHESAMWFTDWWPKIEAKFAVKAFKLRGVSKEKRKELESEAVTWTRNRADPCATVLVPLKNSVARPCAILLHLLGNFPGHGSSTCGRPDGCLWIRRAAIPCHGYLARKKLLDLEGWCWYWLVVDGRGISDATQETFQECMQGGELFDRSWPCKLVPSDFLCFVFFTSFFSHLFFSIFLLYSVPIRLTEAWFPADSAILRSGAKETLHGKGCCSSYLSGIRPFKYWVRSPPSCLVMEEVWSFSFS